ncbi:UNVERIFIED_CONTAM: hypothetical protein NCL1_09981 [Trichonephila clavipes]
MNDISTNLKFARYQNGQQQKKNSSLYNIFLIIQIANKLFELCASFRLYFAYCKANINDLWKTSFSTRTSVDMDWIPDPVHLDSYEDKKLFESDYEEFEESADEIDNIPVNPDI